MCILNSARVLLTYPQNRDTVWCPGMTFHTGLTYLLSQFLSGKNSGPESEAGGKCRFCGFFLWDTEQSSVVDYLDSPEK